MPGGQVLTSLLARLRAGSEDRNGAAVAFLIRLFSAALIYFSQIIVARLLGTAEFGTYVYVWTWVLLGGDLLHFGLASAAQRIVPQYTQQRAFGLLRGFLLGSGWLVFGMAAAAGAVAAMVIWLAQASLQSAEIIALYLACATLPFYAFSNMLDGTARSYGWMGLALFPPYLLRPALFLALVIAAYPAGLALTAATAMSAAVLATAATAAIQALALRRRIRHTLEPGPRSYDLRTWFGMALPMFAGWAFYTGLTYSDVLLLQQFRPAEDVAMYYAAAKSMAVVAFVYFAVSASVARRFSELHVNDDRERLRELVANSVRWTFWPSLLVTALLLLAGPFLLRLFGAGFVDAYPAMQILAIGLVARSAIGPCERLLSMAGEQRAAAAAYAIALAVNVVGAVILIPRLGINGAAAAMSAAIVTETIVLAWLARRRLGISVLVGWSGGGRRQSPAG